MGFTDHPMSSGAYNSHMAATSKLLYIFLR